MMGRPPKTGNQQRYQMVTERYKMSKSASIKSSLPPTFKAESFVLNCGTGVSMIPIERLDTIKAVSSNGYDELLASVKANGILSPLMVTSNTGDLASRCTVLDGATRLQCAKDLGFTLVPCLVVGDTGTEYNATANRWHYVSETEARRRMAAPCRLAASLLSLLASGHTLPTNREASAMGYSNTVTGPLLSGAKSDKRGAVPYLEDVVNGVIVIKPKAPVVAKQEQSGESDVSNKPVETVTPAKLVLRLCDVIGCIDKTWEGFDEGGKGDVKAAFDMLADILKRS